MPQVIHKAGTGAGDHRNPHKKLGLIEQMPLSEHSMQAVEAGLVEYQRIRDESARLTEELREAEKRLYLLEAEINMRDRETCGLRGRCAELEQVIDRKTGDYAVLETILHNVKVQIDAFMHAPKQPASALALISWQSGDHQKQLESPREEKSQEGALRGDITGELEHALKSAHSNGD